MATVTSDPPGEARADEPAPPYSKAYTRYAMTLLLVIYVINFLDRQVINILAEPIKHELHLADWQLGLMTGLGFMLLYTLAAVPIARLAERKSRAVIISVSVVVWSGFSVLCGATQTFVQLYLARMGVGLGESGFTAPAYSLVSDYVTRSKRSSAIAFLYMGSFIGTLAGLAFGGLVADAYGWRAAFLMAGLPGLVIGAVAALTLKDPRGHKIPAAVPDAETAAKATFGATLKYLGGNRTFWWITVGLSFKAFIGFGSGPFTASFFLRNHGQELAQLSSHVGGALHYDLKSIGFFGVTYGVIQGVCACIGVTVGGRVADRLGARDGRVNVWMPAIAGLVGLPLFIGALSAKSALVALPLLGGYFLAASCWFGPAYGTALSIVPPYMRATTSAIILAVVNLIGMGFGPLFVGLISDFVAGPMGLGSGQGIRWGLTCLLMLEVFAFAGFMMAARYIRKDLVE